MKKNAKQAYVMLAIAFVLFCVIAFAVPTAKTASFWIAFAFTVVAFVAQITIWKTAFSKAETLESKFLGLPVIHVGIVYLIIQLVAFAVFMAIPTLPMWMPLVACALILGVSAICFTATDIGKDEIVRVEENVKRKVSLIQALQAEIEILAETEGDAAAKTALINLAEKVRYSDPMSSGELAPLEQSILDKALYLKTATDKLSVVTELELLLTERNNKCKGLK